MPVAEKGANHIPKEAATDVLEEAASTRKTYDRRRCGAGGTGSAWFYLENGG